MSTPVTCPSPAAPWQRPALNPKVEVLTADNDNATVSLTMDTTFLSTSTLKAAPADPYVVALPNGNYLKQPKVLVVPNDVRPTTAPWKVTGTFAGFGFLMFKDIATTAVLMWDGVAWQVLAGNAVQAN
jgi:hypothetical protein